MMSSWLVDYPGDRQLGFFLVSAVGVALVSSAAWLVARRWIREAALRHLVLFSALVYCLAIPAVACVCNMAGVTLVSLPIPRAEHSDIFSTMQQDSVVPAAQPISTPPQSIDPVRPETQPASAASNAATPHNKHADVSPMADQWPTTQTLSERAIERRAGSSATRLSFRRVATGMILMWAVGSLFLLARLARNCGYVLQLRRCAYPVRMARLETLLQDVVDQLHVRTYPLLVMSTRAVSPVAIGFGRPAIILPEQLVGAISDDELRDVLVHEVAHLERGDQWIVLLQELAVAIYWPIVSVHGLNRDLQRAREELCDNVVLAGRDAISYGETLLHVAELLVNAVPIKGAVGIIGGPGELEQRIAGLIDPGRRTMTNTSRPVKLVVLFTFVVAAVLLATTRFASSGPVEAVAQNAGTIQPPTFDVQATQAKEESAGGFSGIVTDLDGKAIRGARIFILPLRDAFDREMPSGLKADSLPPRAETDGDGRFEFDAPDMVITQRDGRRTKRGCFVIATADGYGPAWQEIHTRSPRQNPVEATQLALQLVADDTPIQGRLLDDDGRPLAAARVQLTQLMIPRQRDLDAYFKYVTRDGSPWMNGPGFEQTLYGLVPLAGMTIETNTDADGRFVLAGLGRDRLAELMVTLPSVVDTRITVVTRDAPDIGTYLIQGKPSQVVYGAKFTLTLKRGLTVSGLVRDRDTKQPIPGMWVGWRGDPMKGLSSGQYPRKTDANGRFTITGLDPRLLQWKESFRELMAVSAPGLPYQAGFAEIQKDQEVLIECTRGIPFRLALRDEEGRPVTADVTYREVRPNPHLPRLPYVFDGRWPVGRAADRGDGMYEGFVLPGPGAVLVQPLDRSIYRPAHVDPKTFFAPGRTKWTAQERISTYGTHDTLSSGQGWINQHDYAAIVLVNPLPGSNSLQLSATVAKDKSRTVSLVDPDGKPVAGAKTKGLTFHRYDDEQPLDSASFRLTGLHPDRAKRITFIEENRQLIGELLARSDGETPFTVVMQPWGSVTGQLLDPNGKPIKARLSIPVFSTLETNADISIGQHANIHVDEQGRFRVDQLVPGQRYTAKIYARIGMYAGDAFENLIIQPGEARDLGDIRTKPPINVRGQ